MASFIVDPSGHSKPAHVGVGVGVGVDVKVGVGVVVGGPGCVVDLLV